MSELIDPIAVVIQAQEKKRKDEVQFHIHPEGQAGASGLGNCDLMVALKKSKIPLPDKTGIKAETGGMDVGNEKHEIIQEILREHYTSKDWTEAYPDIIYGEEIYGKGEVIEGQVIVSPIDIAFVTQPGYIQEEIEFANVVALVWVKHPDAKWIKIYDIKSASDLFSYWHYKAEGPSHNYNAQMHFYMTITGLNEIDMLFINKANNKMFYWKVEYDQKFWKDILLSLMRKIEISNTILEWFPTVTEEYTFGDIPNIVREDLAYFMHEDKIECKYCVISETHEEYPKDDKTKKGRIVMDRPCECAANFIRAEALEKFKAGGTYTRGRSHITITRVVGDYIYSQNKGGTEYIDSIFTALAEFKDREA